jgi:heme-degrading monooxygenase HmoA
MGIKIVSQRQVPKDKENAVMPIIEELSAFAKLQPGFHSQETWRHLNQPEKYLIVREWDSEEDWRQWQSSAQRVEIQQRIEAILAMKTEYTPYEIIQRIDKPEAYR